MNMNVIMYRILDKCIKHFVELCFLIQFKSFFLLTLLAGLVVAVGFVIPKSGEAITQNTLVSFDYFSYNYETNQIYYNDKFIANVYEIYFSKASRNAIISKINKFDEPEIYIINDTGINRVTDNNIIEFSPVINDDGDYAYASTEKTYQKSIVYLNGRKLEYIKDDKLYKSLDINRCYLIFAEIDKESDISNIYIHNLSGGDVKTILVPGYVNELAFISDDKFLLNVYSNQNHSLDLHVFDISTNKISIVMDSAYDEIISKIKYAKSFTIDQITGHSNARLLFNAYFSLYRYQFSSPFSISNNFDGRLSWNQSNRLYDLIKLYLFNHDANIRLQLNRIASDLIAVNNESMLLSGQSTPGFSWSTKKYSLDGSTFLSLMVSDACIFYPLLLAVNSNLIDDSRLSEEIINLAEMMYQYHEKYFNDVENIYFFPRNIAFWADGLWMPYNQQNMFGLMLIELFKSTGNDKYKKRVFDLASRFKSEFVHTNNKRILWHYWPGPFYQGWKAKNNLSVNTPERSAYQDKLYEDIAHAGINVKFILEFSRHFPDEVFTDGDLAKLRKTSEGFIKSGHKLTRYMSGDTSTFQPHFRYLPTRGWHELNPDIFKKFYLKLIPKLQPDYNEMGRISGYLNLMHLPDNKDILNINSFAFSIRPRVLNRSTRRYRLNEIVEYFRKSKDIDVGPDRR